MSRVAAIAVLAANTNSKPGRQYLRQIALPEKGLSGFDFYGAGSEVAYVEIRDLAPSEVLVLAAHQEKDGGGGVMGI